MLYQRRIDEFSFRIEDDFYWHEDGDSQPIEWDPENGYGNQILTKNMYPRVAPGKTVDSLHLKFTKFFIYRTWKRTGTDIDLKFQLR